MIEEVMENEFSTIEDALEDVRQGKMIVIVDDEDRENEGDLMIAAEQDRKSTRLNSSHVVISYAVFCLKKKQKTKNSMML